jgi:predicted porin
MKKIFAILALAATSAAFAQNVTISGNFDAGFSSINSQDNTADKQELLGNGASTSLIKFAGTENLGGGMKAGFVGTHLFSATSGQTGNGSTAYSTNNFFNDEAWVGLEGGFGAVKLGAPNAGMHETNSKSQPFGTALGGGYSSTGINRLLGQTTTLGINQFVGGATANGRVIRNEKSVRYDTPTVAGFSANYVYAARNDNSTTATNNSNGFNNATVNYSNGALNAAYSVAKAEAGANIAQGNGAAGALTANADVKYQFLAANYTVGATTVYTGLTTGKTSGLTGGDKKVDSYNVAVKYALTPMVDLLANYVSVDDRATTGAKNQELKALSAIYKFSARTSTYATYQKYDTDKSSNTAGLVTQYMVGMRHQF